MYTLLSFTTHTAHAGVKVLHPVWDHPALTRALLWPITRFSRSHNKDKDPLGLHMLHTHIVCGVETLLRSECVTIIAAAPSMEISYHVCRCVWYVSVLLTRKTRVNISFQRFLFMEPTRFFNCVSSSASCWCGTGSEHPQRVCYSPHRVSMSRGL